MARTTRRQFIQSSVAAAGLGAVSAGCGRESAPSGSQPETASEPLFRISLAQWSLHRGLFGGDPGETIGWENFSRIVNSPDYPTLLAGDVKPLDFPVIARRDFDIDAVEYVNLFYFDRARDQAFLSELKSRADGEGVRNVLIMCDALGAIGAPDEAARKTTVENHHPWVEAARFLGCHSIRVNAASDPGLPPEEQMKLAADGLRSLCEFANPLEINILVENHGGLSSNAQWLSSLMKMVDHPRVGTLPDFGNFNISETESYDRYKGMEELMPYAKSVSAKSYDFDEQGDETTIDFRRIMKIVLDAGFRAFVGIEYEGTRLSEPDGIRATKALLEKIREELKGDYA